MFKTLFSADDLCDLIIEEDAEDPLEARIEIKAQPRGKLTSGFPSFQRKHLLPCFILLSIW